MKLQLTLMFLMVAFSFNVYAQEEIERLKDQIERVHDLARQAEQRGEERKAHELIRHAKQLREKAERIMRNKEVAHKLREMVRVAKKFEREGRKEQAEKVWSKIAKIKKSVQDRQHKMKELHKFWSNFDPSRLEELQEAKREGPELYAHSLKEAYQEMQEIKELKEREPKEYKALVTERKLAKKSWQLAEAYHREKDRAKRAAIKANLHKILNQIFDHKINGHKKEVQELSKELERLQNRLRKRISQKQQIIERRIEKMLEEEEEFEW